MIDFASWLRGKLPVKGSLSLLKLDIEGTEWSLLPRLLATQSLCPLDHLVMEWHLNNAPPESRLAALGLRLSFHTQLRLGCPTGIAPKTVWNVEFPWNNYMVPIPGYAFVLSLEPQSVRKTLACMGLRGPSRCSQVNRRRA